MKKVFKKLRKVSTMKTAAVNPTSQQLPPLVVSVPETQYRSIIGQMFLMVRESITNPPKSRLARVVSQPSKTETRFVSEERTSYLEFCRRAGLAQPFFVSVDSSRDEKTYNHYAAYCTLIGIKPRTIERWEDGQLPRDWRDAGREVEHRNTIEVNAIVNRDVTDPEKTIGPRSFWCADCNQYVYQPQPISDEEGSVVVWKHDGCRKDLVTCDAGPVLHHQTARALQNADKWLFAGKQRREQERLQRLSEFKQTTPVAHKVAWDKSVAEFKETDPLKQRIMWAATPRQADFNDLVVIQDLSTINTWQPPVTPCVDALRFATFDPCTPHSNTHYGVREFKFNSGETIRVCRCTKFDKERSAVLRNGNVDRATPGFEALWSARLDALGLSMNRGFIPVVSDHIEELNNNLHRVNTAGCVGTDYDGKRHDSNARDRRADSWYEEQQTKEPLTRSIDWWSGETIHARAGTNFNSNSRNRQRFWEEWNAGLRKEWGQLAFAHEDDTLLRVWLFIESKRS
jgi:hypothetical protein